MRSARCCFSSSVQGFAIDDAQGADGGSLGSDERHPRVKSDKWGADHEGVVREFRVAGRIGHDHQARTGDGVSAERNFPWSLRACQPVLCLEPLAMFVNERDDRDRDPASLGNQRYEVVELRLRRRIHNLITP